MKHFTQDNDTACDHHIGVIGKPKHQIEKKDTDYKIKKAPKFGKMKSKLNKPKLLSQVLVIQDNAAI